MSRPTSTKGAFAAPNRFACERAGGGGRISPFGSKARVAVLKKLREARFVATGRGVGDSSGCHLRLPAREISPGGVPPERAEAVRVPARKEVAR